MLRSTSSITSFLFLLVLTLCKSNLNFPPLSSIVAETHLHGVSDSELLKHAKSQHQLGGGCIRKKPRRQYYDLQTDQEDIAYKNLYVLCTALKTDARMNGLVNKQASVERHLGIKLAIMNINKNFACYSGMIDHGTLNTEDTQKILRNNEMVAQMLPNVLKVNENVIRFIENMRNLTTKHIDNAQLLIHLYKNSTIIDSITDDNIQDILRTASTNGLMYEPSFDFGEIVESWRRLRSQTEEQGVSICTEMPPMDKNYIRNRHTIKIMILDTFTSDYPLECFIQFVEALADLPVVGRLAIGYSPVAMNYEARGVTQSGVIFQEPFSDANLDGSNQIVGVADSGLDDLSCFVYDDSNTAGDVTTRVQLSSNSFTESDLTIETNRRKVIQYNYNIYTDKVDDQGGHGTHVVGSIIGNCQTNPKMNGMAPKSKVSFFDIGRTGQGALSLAPSYYAVYNSAYLAGARIHSNSWGSSCPPQNQPCNKPYDDSCEAADEFMWDHPEMLLIFAAGNDGSYGKRTLGTPASSKSPVAVGATITRIYSSDEFISQPAITSFSSLGPTDDGRYGIDIAAPGDYIMSACAGDPSTLTNAIDSGIGSMQARSVLHMSGTSMATPVVAGNALLIRQFLMDTNFWAKVCNSADAQCGALSSPSAALVKAILLNSGSAVTRYGIPFDGGHEGTQLLGNPPDIFQGFGQVTLNNVLTLDDGTGMNPDKALFIYDDLSLSSGSIQKFAVALSSVNAGKNLDLKATIVWTDKPYDVFANGASILLNDVDLLVETPQGNVYWGNRQPDGDDKNTVEQVHIATANEEGNYMIYIRANTLVTSTQKVSLVLTYPCDSYPSNKGTVYVTGPTSLTSLPTGLTEITASPTIAPSSVPPLPTASPTIDPPTVIKHTLNAPEGATIGPNFEDTGLVFIGNISAQGLLKSIEFDLSVAEQESWSLYSLLSSVLITAPTGERIWVGGYFSDIYDSENLFITSSWPYNSQDMQNLPFTKELFGAEVETKDVGDWQIHVAFGYNWRPADTYTSIVASDLIGSVSLKIDTAGTTPHPTAPPTTQPTSPTPLPTIQPTATPFTVPTLAPTLTAYPTTQVNLFSFQMTGLSQDEILNDLALLFALKISISRALQVEVVHISDLVVEEVDITSSTNINHRVSGIFRWKLESNEVTISSYVSSEFVVSSSTASVVQHEFRSEVQSIQPWRDTSTFNVSNVATIPIVPTKKEDKGIAAWLRDNFLYLIIFFGLASVAINGIIYVTGCNRTRSRSRNRRPDVFEESGGVSLEPIIRSVPSQQQQSLAVYAEYNATIDGKAPLRVDESHEDHPTEPPLL